MYDLLTIWDVDNSRPEMEQLGLRILLAFAAQPDIVVRRSRKGGGGAEREGCCGQSRSRPSSDATFMLIHVHVPVAMMG